MLTNSLISKNAQSSLGANGLASVGRISAFGALLADPLEGSRNAGLAEAGVQISPADVAKRLAASWNGMSAEIVQVTRREKFEFRFRAKSHLLVVHEQGARSDGETVIDGLPRSTLRDFRHKLTFVPAGYEYREWHDPRVMARVIFLYVDPARIPNRAETGEPPEFQPRMFFENAALRETAVKLAASIEGGSADDVSYLEALGAVLVHELVRLALGLGAPQLSARGGLAGWQRRAVTAYIEEHLDETIPLSRLAELARLSQYYFCRAFKESVGLPPHRYHIMRRIERAKGLLATATPSVTEIGLAVGFSETSSFTAAFRKMTGQTPTSYRRSFS
jgi:AraC family transcriptional regulator